jgi:hypothetical protein
MKRFHVVLAISKLSPAIRTILYTIYGDSKTWITTSIAIECSHANFSCDTLVGACISKLVEKFWGFCGIFRAAETYTVLCAL